MKSIPLPSLPWEIISQDLFTLEQRSYLVTVCHFSDWVEVDELVDTLSTTIVNKTKVHFARFGIPRVCHTDNGPQFVGKAYKEFAKEYDFNHTTSSPYHPQGNG
jgi:transposase InsO family protein